ncbi:DUF2090 domain-containing protein [Patescibacteria group bacterium]|nr:DUF2090 domain-containing protein [Patescibacteria group bacterium]
MKRVVFDAFLKIHKTDPYPEHLAILIDEEFGSDIIKQARAGKIHFALSTEKSGQQVYQFEYGRDFRKHLMKLRPTYAKALVRYNIANKKDNALQRKRLKVLSNFCQKEGLGLMLEILLTGQGSRLEQMKIAMKEMIRAGIRPTVWKMEGLPNAAQWKQIGKLTDARIIVLGRGETKAGVEAWVKAAAQSGAVDGFAIGRTIFFRALEQYRDKKIDRKAAISRIAKNYQHFIELWRRHAR